MKNKISLFLDSGAFSAFTQKKEIDVYDYIKFIKDNEKHIDIYANLDVIRDAEATLRNQKIMEKKGLHPIPVFHKREDFKYLKDYVDNYDYIAIGGIASGETTESLVKFLNTCWKQYICNTPDHMPRVKVHGFGVTSLNVMLRYPWYSVDSTTWVIASRMGGVMTPRFVNDKYIYDENSWKVTVSSRSPDKKDKGKHISTFSPDDQQRILDYFKKKGYALGKSSFKTVSKGYELKEGERWWGKELTEDEKRPQEYVVKGITVKKKKKGEREVEIIEEPGLCNDYKLRDELNIIFFLDLEKSIPEWPWPLDAKKIRTGF
jgi:hypothetical protein